MTSHRLTRLGTVLTLTAACAGGTAALAPQAHAVTPPPCTPYFSMIFDKDTSPHSIQATAYEVCPNKTLLINTVIYKDGTEVASGLGGASYSCDGTKTNTFTANIPELGSLTAACG